MFLQENFFYMYQILYDAGTQSRYVCVKIYDLFAIYYVMKRNFTIWNKRKESATNLEQSKMSLHVRVISEQMRQNIQRGTHGVASRQTTFIVLNHTFS